MIKTRMPDPVAWLRIDELRKLGEPYSDSPINQRTDSMLLHAKGTESAAKRYGFDAPVITTTQAEAYADARVRQVLEKLEQACIDADYLSEVDRAIRALIPPLPGPVEPTT